MITGHPALRRLVVLKFWGALRRQVRKMKTLSGAFFALVGALISFAWIASLMIGRGGSGGEAVDPETMRGWAELGIAVFTGMSLISALSIRGIYLPTQDIERLFAGPVKRSDLIRYRMLVDLGRSLFGALVLGLLTFHRMPVAIFGLVGAMLSILTLGVLRQTLSLLLGGAGSGMNRFLKSRSLIFLRVLAALAVWAIIMAAVMGGELMREVLGDIQLPTMGGELLHAPWMRRLLSPFHPWASLMTAQDPGEFFRWLGICLGIGLLLFEFTARLPIDFRETSLETSAQISKRISQVRRGGLFSGGKVSKRTQGWSFPRLFGKGPMGAVAWVKLVSIVRKARGTLIMGFLIVFFVTLIVTLIMRGKAGEPDAKLSMLGSGLIGLFGITYLGAALRFDFRSDLDRMVQIKAWPVSPGKVFFGTLLPEVTLISTMLGVAILIRLVVLGQLEPQGLIIPAVLPLFAFAWLAVDNVVYLFAPVRFVPGQEGSLHHTGRAIVLLLLRLLCVAAVFALVGLAAIILFGIGPREFGLSREQAIWVAAAVGLVVLMGLNAFLAWLGGRMLRRFDVARDRG